MKVFRIKRLKCFKGDNCPNFDAHNGYSGAGHEFSKTRFEQATGMSWERGYRTFILLMVSPRTKRGSKRG